MLVKGLVSGHVVQNRCHISNTAREQIVAILLLLWKLYVQNGIDLDFEAIYCLGAVQDLHV